MSPVVLSVLVIIVLGVNLLVLIFSFKLLSSFNNRIDSLTQAFQGNLTQQFLQLTQSVHDSLGSPIPSDRTYNFSAGSIS